MVAVTCGTKLKNERTEAEGLVRQLKVGFACQKSVSIICNVREVAREEGSVQARLGIGRKSGDDLMRWQCIARGRLRGHKKRTVSITKTCCTTALTVERRSDVLS